MSRRMKDSGVAWIGEIPEEWEIHIISQLYEMRNNKVNDTDWQPLSVTKNGILPQLDSVAKTSANEDRKQVIAGDFVINSRSDRKQSCGLSVLNGSVSLIYTVIYNKPNSHILPEFTKYVLNNYGFAEEFFRWGSGIVMDLWSTKWDLMKRIFIPYPSVSEQKKIYFFLENKCQQIDRLIVLQEEMIAELQAYKQSVITEAVTKGLDPDAPMKDSGIEWVGEIPYSWNISKVIRGLSMPITDGPHETPNFYDQGIPFISAEAIKKESIDFNLKRGFISADYYDQCCLKYKPEINDIYMVKSGATTGRIAMVKTENVFTIWSPLAVFRCNNRFIPNFLFYVLQSDGFQKQIQLRWSFGTQQNIGMRVLESLLVPFVAIVEQKTISDYLDEKCNKINQMINLKQSKIETLKEYKKSLIYECVTGKRDCTAGGQIHGA